MRTNERLSCKQRAQYVFDHHMKKTEGSPQLGRTYEYFHAGARDTDQLLQGDAARYHARRRGGSRGLVKLRAPTAIRFTARSSLTLATAPPRPPPFT